MPAGYVFRFDKWGGDIWRMFHSTTFLYPEQDPTDANKMLIRQYIAILPFLLPCSMCGMNFMKELEDHPLGEAELASRDALSRWGVVLHNTVNRRLNKAEVSYESVYRYFMLDATTDPRSDAMGGVFSCSNAAAIAALILLIVLTVMVVLLAIVVIRRRRKQ